MSDLFSTVHAARAAREYQQAAALLSQIFSEQPTSSIAIRVVAEFGQIRNDLSLSPCRLALLRSFTIEPVVPFLRVRCFAAGIDAAVHVGDFNAYGKEMLDPQSTLYAFGPNIAILAVRTADVIPAFGITLPI